MFNLKLLLLILIAIPCVIFLIFMLFVLVNAYKKKKNDLVNKIKDSEKK